MLHSEITLFFISIFLVFSLGLFVYLKNRRQKINQSFLLFALMVVVWIIGNYLQDENLSQFLRIFFLKLDLAISPVLLCSFVNFCFYYAHSYLNWHKAKVRLVKLILFIFSLVFFGLVFFTKTIIKEISFTFEIINPLFGPLYPYFSLFLVFLIVFGLLILLIRYQKDEQNKKKKTRGIFFGFFLMFFFIFLTDYLLPYFYKESGDMPLFYPRLGVFSILFLVVFISYAIVQYNAFKAQKVFFRFFLLAIIFIFLLEIFFPSSERELLFSSAVFLLILYFSWMLNRSLRLEVLARDDLEKATQRLKKANWELAKLDKAKSEFISIVSHQLRTPLTSIKGFTSLLLEGLYGRVSQKQKEVLQKVFISNERLVLLVEDMLNISRMEKGKLEYRFEKLDAREIIENVFMMMKIQANAKKLNLFFENKLRKKEKAFFMGDQKKILEVVSNLVDNAIKYTQAGEVKIILQKRGKKIRIEVKDTGIGIKKEEQKRLFQRFTRGAGVHLLHTNGTGLGLYIVKNIIKAHKGRVWIESKGVVGKGTTFILEFSGV